MCGFLILYKDRVKVTVSVFGRFHGFYLARELHKRGHLRKLITSYPKFEVAKYGIPKKAVSSLVAHELAHRTWNRWLPSTLKPTNVDLRATFADWFDHAAAQRIPSDTDVYVGWSSKSETGIARAQEYGATTVLERGSAHIEVQRDLLKEEYERFGKQTSLPHPEIIEKEKREYEAADYIAIPSTFVRRTFRERGIPESKLIQVPYGVDLDSFSPVEKRDNTFRVVYAGSMSLRKGVHYLLHAFAELDLPNAELWLLGRKTPEVGPFFEKYGDSFHHLGHKPQEELYEYYSQGSIFVLPSIEEGLAMVQAQAMACELPLVCTENTGGQDLIEEGEQGFVVPIRDAEALKEKILWCYENQEQCREMGRSARRRVQDSYSWSDYGDRIINAYQKVIDS